MARLVGPSPEATDDLVEVAMRVAVSMDQAARTAVLVLGDLGRRTDTDSGTRARCLKALSNTVFIWIEE